MPTLNPRAVQQMRAMMRSQDPQLRKLGEILGAGNPAGLGASTMQGALREEPSVMDIDPRQTIKARSPFLGAVLDVVNTVGQIPGVEMLLGGAGQVAPAMLGRAATQGQKGFRAAAQVVRKQLVGSKVRDARGPKLVFHGTPKAFGKFDVRQADENALYGPGIYFTENAKVAGGGNAAHLMDLGYATGNNAPPMAMQITRGGPLKVGQDFAGAKVEKVLTQAEDPRIGVGMQQVFFEQSGSPNVRPAFLDIKNPFVIDGEIPVNEAADLMRRAGADEVFIQGMKSRIPPGFSGVDGHSLYGRLESVFQVQNFNKSRTFNQPSKAALNKFLQSQGFDGITHMGGGTTGADAHRVWIAFSPDQVIPAFKPGAPTNFRTRRSR